MDEIRVNTRDLDGEEIYLDIPIDRAAVNEIIAETVQDTVDVARQTLEKVGLTDADFQKLKELYLED